jgi:hypothetical protein
MKTFSARESRTAGLSMPQATQPSWSSWASVRGLPAKADALHSFSSARRIDASGMTRLER